MKNPELTEYATKLVHDVSLVLRGTLDAESPTDLELLTNDIEALEEHVLRLKMKVQNARVAKLLTPRTEQPDPG